jgi:hypothetical protein
MKYLEEDKAMQLELEIEFGKDWYESIKVTIEAPVAFTGDRVSFCNPRLKNDTLACGRVISVDTRWIDQITYKHVYLVRPDNKSYVVRVSSADKI